MKKPVGHPVTRFTPEELTRLDLSLRDYITSQEIPILKEWCLLEKLSPTQIYEHPGLSEAMKRCITAKEVALERRLYAAGPKNESCTGYIFGLKQLGWKDTHSVETTFPDGITVKYA
jgi:hypothetical protein